MAGGKASARKIKVAERQHKALELRKQGYDFRAIADLIREDESLGEPKYSESQAHRDCHAVLKRTLDMTNTGAAELREMESQRLDIAARAIAQSVKNGHLGAIDRWLKIVDQRCKLLGLNLDDLNKAWGTLEAYGFERVEDGEGGYRLVDKYTSTEIESGDRSVRKTSGDGLTSEDYHRIDKYGHTGIETFSEDAVEDEEPTQQL